MPDPTPLPALPRQPTWPSPSSSAAGAGTHFVPENEVHLLDRLAVLYRYRRLCVTVFILSSAAMIIQSYTTIQMYQAMARLEINDERSTAVPGLANDLNTYYEDPEPYFSTQHKILKGRDLTRRVVRKLHLDTVPEFNGTASPPPTPVTLLHGLEGRLIALVRPAPAAAPEPPKADESSDESSLVSSFIGRVEVLPVRGSHLVDLTFTAQNPRFAATAANALADEYVDQNLQIKLQSTQGMLDWLERELAGQQQKVEDSERALAQYRERENALSLDEKQNIVLSRLNQLNDAATRARTARAQKESLYSQVKSIASGTAPDAIPVVGQNPSVQNAKSKLASLQAEKVKLLDRYGEKHPQVVQVNTALADAQRQYDLAVGGAVQSVRNEYEAAIIEERSLSQNLEGAKAEATVLNRKGIGYGVMEREAKSNREVYQSLLTREKELRVSANSRTNNVRVIDHAEIPKAPVTPGGRRTWLISIVVGLVLSIAVALGLDYMNDTIKTPEDVTRRLKLPFLGLVPSVRGDKHPLLASSHVPHDFGESFRALRTSLLSKYPSEGTKIFIVTSAQPLEGKTTTAANIAMALAYGGSRVLLIDADMRRPGLHRPLAGAHRPGARARRHSADRGSQPSGNHRRPHAAESVRAAVVGAHEDAAHQPRARAVRLDHHRYATGSRRDRRRHPGADGEWRHVRDRRRNDAPPSRGARDRHRDAEPAALCGGRAEQGRFRQEQVLLFAVLRPSVQELLRRSGALIVRPQPSPSFFSSAGPWSRSQVRIAGRSYRCAWESSCCWRPSGRGSAVGRGRSWTGRSSRVSRWSPPS
jgi:polysaccharide biosynthesis transport protein